MGLRWGAHIPDIGHWARRWIDHWVCDAWPVRRQTYGYLPSRRASPPFGRYQIILLGDRGPWVWTTCPELLLGSGLAGSRTRDLSITSQWHQATQEQSELDNRGRNLLIQLFRKSGRESVVDAYGSACVNRQAEGCAAAASGNAGERQGWVHQAGGEPRLLADLHGSRRPGIQCQPVRCLQADDLRLRTEPDQTTLPSHEGSHVPRSGPVCQHL